MTLLTIDEIKEFERELDATLDALPSLRCDGETTIALACDAIEIYHKDPKHHYTATHFDRGLDVLLPIWITSKGTEEPQIEQLLGDLHFASSYYMLREYLYYTYNAPETLNWYRDHDGNISIKINDPTLTRQYYLKTSNGFVGSMETFKDNDTENILALVRGTDEFGQREAGTMLVDDREPLRRARHLPGKQARVPSWKPFNCMDSGPLTARRLPVRAPDCAPGLRVFGSHNRQLPADLSSAISSCLGFT